ncbi:hypothetical protein E2C01_070186 [Portunus trituberculatus]|uniref:Uncharacterized protein n=1 Tax=Portunus trituberculatus TaxID=210409 RepID=A0A5B7HTI2_PORTR|nr:hypothetical protein [Portunus trituberculatus]
MRQPVPQMTCVADPHDTRPVVEETKQTPAADKPHLGIAKVSHPIVTIEPLNITETVALEKQNPDVFNVSAVTRTMAKVLDTLPEIVEDNEMSENDESSSVESEVSEGDVAHLF